MNAVLWVQGSLRSTKHAPFIVVRPVTASVLWMPLDATQRAACSGRLPAVSLSHCPSSPEVASSSLLKCHSEVHTELCSRSSVLHPAPAMVVSSPLAVTASSAARAPPALPIPARAPTLVQHGTPLSGEKATPRADPLSLLPAALHSGAPTLHDHGPHQQHSADLEAAGGLWSLGRLSVSSLEGLDTLPHDDDATMARESRLQLSSRAPAVPLSAQAQPSPLPTPSPETQVVGVLVNHVEGYGLPALGRDRSLLGFYRMLRDSMGFIPASAVPNEHRTEVERRIHALDSGTAQRIPASLLPSTHASSGGARATTPSPQASGPYLVVGSPDFPSLNSLKSRLFNYLRGSAARLAAATS